MRYYITNTEHEARKLSLRIYSNGVDWVAEVPAYVHIEALEGMVWLYPNEAAQLGYFNDNEEN